jgi:hypothetical protein
MEEDEVYLNRKQEVDGTQVRGSVEQHPGVEAVTEYFAREKAVYEEMSPHQPISAKQNEIYLQPAAFEQLNKPGEIEGPEE